MEREDNVRRALCRRRLRHDHDAALWHRLALTAAAIASCNTLIVEGGSASISPPPLAAPRPPRRGLRRRRLRAAFASAAFAATPLAMTEPIDTIGTW